MRVVGAQLDAARRPAEVRLSVSPSLNSSRPASQLADLRLARERMQISAFMPSRGENFEQREIERSFIASIAGSQLRCLYAVNFTATGCKHTIRHVRVPTQ